MAELIVEIRPLSWKRLIKYDKTGGITGIFALSISCREKILNPPAASTVEFSLGRDLELS